MEYWESDSRCFHCARQSDVLYMRVPTTMAERRQLRIDVWHEKSINTYATFINNGIEK